MADPTEGYSKAVAAGASGALVSIAAWIANQFFHVQIPMEIAASIQTVIVAMFVYFTPHSITGA